MESEAQVDNLKSLFQKGIESIGTQRHDNIFQDLETRALTTTEQDIINQRVALQRRLFEEYEKREQARKVAELREVCPDLSDAAALKALELCGGREDEAAEELVSSPSFRARAMQAVVPVVPVSSKPNASSGSGGGETEQQAKLLDWTTTVHAEVFVGAFRGKGYPTTGAPKVSLSLLRKQNIDLGPAQEDPGCLKGSGSGAPDLRCAVEGDQQQPADDSERTQPDAYPESPRTNTDDAAEEAGTKTPDPVPCASPSSTARRRVSSGPAGSRSPAARSAAVPYGLAVESQGRVRPAHDAEVEAVTLSRTIVSSPENDDENMVVRSSESDDKQNEAAVLEEEDDQSVGLGDLAVPKEEEQAPHMRHPRAAKTAALACFFLAEEEEEDRRPESSDDDDAEGEESMNNNGGGLEKKRLGSRPRKAPSQPIGAGSHSSDDERPRAKRPRSGSIPVSEGDTGSFSSQGGNDSETTLTDGEPPNPRRSSRRTAGRRDIVNDGSNASSRTHNNGSFPTGVLPTSQSLPPMRRYGGVQAVSASGHTNRGRVRQKSHKSAELVQVGELRAVRGWCNSGYIFPLGFVSRTLFRSSVALDQLCVHDCYVLGEGGEFWPAPTFRVVARDRPDEPLTAKSCTGCWTAVLKRINGEIASRRAAGENLPPPPKTAIAGPEYFGFNQVNIQEAVEALDPGRLCVEYWAGKEQRLRAAAGLPAIVASGPSSKAGGADHSSRGRANRRRGSTTNNSDDADSEEDDGAAYASRWSTINRSERYRKRREDAGDDVAAIDEDNPLPELLDPITLEPVVRPAISPYGHVMGMATWKAVLAEKKCCPFTKQPLTWEQCKILTKNNIHLYADRIIK